MGDRQRAAWPLQPFAGRSSLWAAVGCGRSPSEASRFEQRDEGLHSAERAAERAPERLGRRDDSPCQWFGRIVADGIAGAVGNMGAGASGDEVARGYVPFPGRPEREHRVEPAFGDKAEPPGEGRTEL